MTWLQRIQSRVGRVSLVATIAVFLLLPAAQRNDARADGEAGRNSSAAPDSVTISDAWARATPVGAHMGAIYLKLTSASGDRLLRASVPHSVTAKTQIHETIVRHDPGGGGDSMEMREVGSIELPAGEIIELKPGGFHLMLIDLKHPLKVGETVTVTLRFEKAGTRTVTAAVRGM